MPTRTRSLKVHPADLPDRTIPVGVVRGTPVGVVLLDEGTAPDGLLVPNPRRR